MKNTKFYSQANHAVYVSSADGGAGWSRVLSDFSESNAIAWEPVTADKVAATEGLDGSRISFASVNAGKITVKLKPTSPDIGWLTRIYNLNRTNPQLLNVTIYTGVNEIHSLVNCGLNIAGGETGGNTMSERTFTFVGEELSLDESDGE